MSGAKRFFQPYVTIVLALFCFYVIKLALNDELTLYIHPRYVLFAVSMSAIGLFMLLIGGVIEYRQTARQSHHHDDYPRRLHILDYLALGLLCLAFLLPPQTLSSNATSRKTINIPAAPILDNPYIDCLEVNSNWQLQSWVYSLGNLPARCFEGKGITFIGTTIESPDTPLPEGFVYVGRVVISCCIIDARPYALPVAIAAPSYPKDTWIKVQGTMKLKKLGGKQLFVVVPQTVEKIDAPSDGVYQYLN